MRIEPPQLVRARRHPTSRASCHSLSALPQTGSALEKHQLEASSVQEPVHVDESYERRLWRWSLIQVTLLIVAISAMATARYIP